MRHLGHPLIVFTDITPRPRPGVAGRPGGVAQPVFATRVMKGRAVMPQGKVVFAGLNQTGLIVFIILLFFCLPICWIPWLIDSMKGDPNASG